MSERIIFNRQQVIAALRREAINGVLYTFTMDIPPADECNVEITLDGKGRILFATLTWEDGHD